MLSVFRAQDLELGFKFLSLGCFARSSCLRVVPPYVRHQKASDKASAWNPGRHLEQLAGCVLHSR